jgi:hypothetical protein
MMKRISLSLPVRLQRTLVVLLVGAALMTWSAPTQTVFAHHRQEKDLNPNLSRTAFAYQGQLKEGSLPANGSYDFQFTLYTAQTGGAELGSILREDIALINGLFKVELDFGRTASEGQESWLEVAVRPAESTDAYSRLSPRQRLTPTPYAIFAQQERWSLIGVPIGFASGGDNRLVAAAKIPDFTKSTDSPENQATSAGASNAALAASGTPNFIAKFDASGNPTANSVMFDDGARVGLGTTTPEANLQVHGIGGLEQSQQGRNFTPTVSVFSTNFLLPQGFGQLGLYTTDAQAPDIGGQLVLGGKDGVTHVRSFAAIAGRKENNISGNRDGYLQFSVRSNVGPPYRDLQERMRITSAGNVGIGTTNPTRKLEVFEDVDSVTSMGIRNPNPGSRATAVLAVNSDGAQGSLFAHSSSYIAPHRADRVSLVAESNAAGVDVVTTQASGDIRLFSGGYSDFNERMRITNTGHVGIGTSAPRAKLHVQGDSIYLGSAGQGIILKSPNGAVCRKLTIDNAGAIVLAAIACP